MFRDLVQCAYEILENFCSEKFSRVMSLSRNESSVEPWIANQQQLVPK